MAEWRGDMAASCQHDSLVEHALDGLVQRSLTSAQHPQLIPISCARAAKGKQIINLVPFLSGSDKSLPSAFRYLCIADSFSLEPSKTSVYKPAVF